MGAYMGFEAVGIMGSHVGFEVECASKGSRAIGALILFPGVDCRLRRDLLVVAIEIGGGAEFPFAVIAVVASVVGGGIA